MSANSTQKILELFQVLICWYSIKVSIFTTRSQIQNKQTSPKETFSCTQNISKIHMPQRDRDFGCNFKVLGFRRVHGCISRSMVASAKAQPATTNNWSLWLMHHQISQKATKLADVQPYQPKCDRIGWICLQFSTTSKNATKPLSQPWPQFKILSHSVKSSNNHSTEDFISASVNQSTSITIKIGTVLQSGKTNECGDPNK